MKTPADLLMRPNQRVRRKTYFEYLDSEEWLSFAGAFRARHSNACNICRQSGIETQVHHIAYDFDRKPWEYADSELVLLCSLCHKAAHAELSKFRRYVFGKLNPASFRVLNGALSVGLDHNDPLELVYAIAELCASPASVKRFAAAFKPSPAEAEQAALNARAAGGSA